jgi:hypothetical protein
VLRNRHSFADMFCLDVHFLILVESDERYVCVPVGAGWSGCEESRARYNRGCVLQSDLGKVLDLAKLLQVFSATVRMHVTEFEQRGRGPFDALTAVNAADGDR